jgi:hypothetical protein
MDVILALYAPQSHFQSIQWVDGLQRGANAPSDDFLSIGIQDERQVTEDIMTGIHPDDDIRNITDP